MNRHLKEIPPEVSFTAYTNGNICIGDVSRMGTTSITNSLPNYTLEKHALWQGGEVRNDNVYIILLRDVLSRWKSGYKSEFLANPSVIDSGLKHYLQNKMYIDGFNQKGSKFEIAKDVMGFLHDSRNFGNTDLRQRWIYRNHARFWQWNSSSLTSLSMFAQHPQVHFMELKHLSNPKFIEWCKKHSKGDDWDNVKKIKHQNKTQDWFWPQINLFWEEYKKGLYLQDRHLIYPLPSVSKDLLYHGSIDPDRGNTTEISNLSPETILSGTINSIEFLDPLWLVLYRIQEMELRYIQSVFANNNPNRYLNFD